MIWNKSNIIRLKSHGKIVSKILYLIFRDVSTGQSSKQTSEGHFPSSHLRLNHQSDIVTVSSGLSKRHKDDNYQILSVAGMPSLPLDRQNNAVPENSTNDSKKDDNIEQSKPTPPGQQVEFLAHL